MPHANRSKKADNPARNPTPEQVRESRERKGYSQSEAAKIELTTLRSWQNWEIGQEAGGSRMHPAIWRDWQTQIGEIRGPTHWYKAAERPLTPNDVGLVIVGKTRFGVGVYGPLINTRYGLFVREVHPQPVETKGTPAAEVDVYTLLDPPSVT